MIGDILAKVQADIERVGWSSIGVFPTVDDPDHRHFVYTIGLFDQDDHPELLIAGVPFEMASGILGALYDRVALGERFAEGQTDDGVLIGYDVVFRPLPDGRPANIARRYYGVEQLPVLQVVWPDKDGRFPGDPDCDPAIVHDQDCIGE